MVLRRRGFTLVELLVTIAIISKNIDRSVYRGTATIQGAETPGEF